MPVYTYTALAENGMRIQGEESALSEQVLREDLARRGLLAQELRSKRAGFGLPARQRIKPEAFLLLNQEFTALLRAGLTIPEAFQVVIECRYEGEQQSVFERMTGEGYTCRLLTL